MFFTNMNHLHVRCAFLCIVFVNLLCVGDGNIPEQKLCADKECSTPISEGVTLIQYSGRVKGCISFGKNKKVKVYGKGLKEEDYWDVTIGDKRGYMPPKFMKETKINIHPGKLIDVRNNKDVKEVETQPSISVVTNDSSTLATPSITVAPNREAAPDIVPLFLKGVSADSTNNELVTPPSEVVDGTTLYFDPNGEPNDFAPSQTKDPLSQSTQAAEPVSENPNQDEELDDYDDEDDDDREEDEDEGSESEQDETEETESTEQPLPPIMQLVNNKVPEDKAGVQAPALSTSPSSKAPTQVETQGTTPSPLVLEPPGSPDNKQTTTVPPSEQTYGTESTSTVSVPTSVESVQEELFDSVASRRQLLEDTGSQEELSSGSSTPSTNEGPAKGVTQSIPEDTSTENPSSVDRKDITNPPATGPAPSSELPPPALNDEMPSTLPPPNLGDEIPPTLPPPASNEGLFFFGSSKTEVTPNTSEETSTESTSSENQKDIPNAPAADPAPGDRILHSLPPRPLLTPGSGMLPSLKPPTNQILSSLPPPPAVPALIDDVPMDSPNPLILPDSPDRKVKSSVESLTPGNTGNILSSLGPPSNGKPLLDAHSSSSGISPPPTFDSDINSLILPTSDSDKPSQELVTPDSDKLSLEPLTPNNGKPSLELVTSDSDKISLEPLTPNSGKPSLELVTPVSDVLPPAADSSDTPDPTIDNPDTTDTDPGFIAGIVDSLYSMLGLGASEEVPTPEVMPQEEVPKEEVPSVSVLMNDLDSGTCKTVSDLETNCQDAPVLKETEAMGQTWQERVTRVDSADTLIFVLITAVTILLFNLGYYYIEKSRNDGPLIAKVNKLEQELLVSSKENSLVNEELETTRHNLLRLEQSAPEPGEMVKALRVELAESKKKCAELETLVDSLQQELDAATEAGLDLNVMLTEVLTQKHGSDTIMQSVEHLQKQLDTQQKVIDEMNESLAAKSEQNAKLDLELRTANELVETLEQELSELKENLEVQLKEKEEASEELHKHNAELSRKVEGLTAASGAVEGTVKDLQAKLAEVTDVLTLREGELKALKDSVKAMRKGDTEELFNVGMVKAELAKSEKDKEMLQETLREEEGARALLEEHVKSVDEEVSRLRANYEEAEKEKVEAQTRLEVLSNYFKEKETQLQKELGLQEAMWVQKQGDDTTVYERMKSLQEEVDNYNFGSLGASNEGLNIMNPLTSNSAVTNSLPSLTESLKTERRGMRSPLSRFKTSSVELTEQVERPLETASMTSSVKALTDSYESLSQSSYRSLENLHRKQSDSSGFEKSARYQSRGLESSATLELDIKVVANATSSVHKIAKKKKSMRQTFGSQNDLLKKEIIDQERGLKGQIATLEKKARENWVAARQAERKLEDSKQEAGNLRNRLTLIEKNISNDAEAKPANQVGQLNGGEALSPIHPDVLSTMMFPPLPPDPSHVPPGFMPPPFMPPPPGAYLPPPPPPFLPGDRRPPPLGRMSSPPLNRRFSPPPPDYAYDRMSPPPLSPPLRSYRSPNESDRFRHRTPPSPSYPSRSWEEGQESSPAAGFRPVTSHRDTRRGHKGSAMSSGHSSSDSLDKSSRHSGKV